MLQPEVEKRIAYLIELGEKCLEKVQSNSLRREWVPIPDYLAFRTSVLSFIDNLFGKDNIHYTTVHHNVIDESTQSIKNGLALLQVIKNEIENGWLGKMRDIVTAELFSDFLEMSKHLLEEKYKDAAAVMIGSVLEEHLRLLASIHGVSPTNTTDKGIGPKKANTLNVDLVKAGVYGVLDQKNVTAWLDLRNRAAHGKYGDYVISQVELMYQGVLAFITRVK